MIDPHAWGRDAEAAARRYLESIGFTIVHRRFRVRRGEIDLVALDGDQLVFVEVKARRRGDPEATIGPRKRAALIRAAHAYLAEIGEPDRGFRLDLIAVSDSEIRHVRDRLTD